MAIYHRCQAAIVIGLSLSPHSLRLPPKSLLSIGLLHCAILLGRLWMPRLLLSLGCCCCPVPFLYKQFVCVPGRPLLPFCMPCLSPSVVAMSTKNSPAATANHMFVPRPLEPVQVDKITVKLYPVVDSSMKPPKCTHAFQTNKAALSAPGIDRRAMLDTLGVQLNPSAIIDGVLGDWNCLFHCNWCNFQHLTILSFHSSTGTQVNDTTNMSDSAILMPIVKGSLADCCKQVCFVLVQLNLDFASLVPPGVQGLTILKDEFYIELLQSTLNERSQPITSRPCLAMLTSVPCLPPTSLTMSCLTPSRMGPSTYFALNSTSLWPRQTQP
jgi:hypothetical protein